MTNILKIGYKSFIPDTVWIIDITGFMTTCLYSLFPDTFFVIFTFSRDNLYLPIEEDRARVIECPKCLELKSYNTRIGQLYSLDISNVEKYATYDDIFWIPYGENV